MSPSAHATTFLEQFAPALVVVGLTLTTMSCAHGAPRLRRGGLPNPGLMTLFSLADPDHLGTTRYERRPPFLGKFECGHGILYTERAGFLDMAHIRMTMDWCRYVAAKVSLAIDRGDRELTLARQDDSQFKITFTYPRDWRLIDSSVRRRFTEELSLRIGERVALELGTWHEIITWFGFGSVFFYSEKASAFTYEDTVSHAVAIRAADVALRAHTSSWNNNATQALNDELKRLRVVSLERAHNAVELVRGKWWFQGICIRRMTDVGDTDNAIHPWLVRGMPGGDQPSEAFPLPTLTNIDGRDFSTFYVMTITPGRRIPRRIRDLLPDHPTVINVAKNFPFLLEEVRQDIKREFGASAVQPYDD